MKNKRIYWILRTSLSGGYFLAADGVPYFINLFETVKGPRCEIMDHQFFRVSGTIKIETAKRKIKQLIKGD